MATLANDLKPEVTLKTGGYGGKKLYSFKTETDANTYYLLAHTGIQAGKMATQIASDLSETISTAVALAPVYVQEGIQQA